MSDRAWRLTRAHFAVTTTLDSIRVESWVGDHWEVKDVFTEPERASAYILYTLTKSRALAFEFAERFTRSLKGFPPIIVREEEVRAWLRHQVGAKV